MAENGKVKITPGIGALLTDDKGNVVAHAFDFERQGYGGFKLWESQQVRAKKAVTYEYIKAYCYGVMASAIDDYTADRIVEKLRHDKKLTLTFVSVGHELAPAELNR